MPNATKPFANRVAVVFDFDETLAPDTFEVLLRDLGLDPATFKREKVQPLVDQGWDTYLARGYCLIQESQQRPEGDKITKERLARIGQELEPFAGVTEMFAQLRQCGQQIISDVEVEFYLITGGFLEIMLNTSIAENFRAMWGCRFHCNAMGEIEFVKQQMTNTEKTRYLYYLSKGIDKNKDKDLVFAYQSLPDDQLHVPLSQVIYVGDGASDAPCFAVLHEYQGTAIGLYKDDDTRQWAEQDKISTNQRLANIALPDYRPESELLQSLKLAVEKICKQIAIRRLSIGE